MKALLYSNTHADDYTCQLPDILACGSSMDDRDMLEQFSDSLSLLTVKWGGCVFHIWSADESKHSVHGTDISFAEVVEAFCAGDTHELSVDVPATRHCGAYTENWSVREIPGAKYALVKSGMEANGDLVVPSIQYSGSEEYCNAKMEEIRERSGEELEGDDGHWWYKGTEGEVVCYDIVEI